MNSPPPGTTNVFTLAHLSDPHLTSLDGATVAQLANKRILGYLSWRRRRRRIHRIEVLDAVVADIRRYAPDHVAITGDLTHVGLPAECAAASAWLATLGGGDAVSLVPGNHDRYVRDSDADTVGRWRDFSRGDTCERDLPFLRRRGQVALIGVDTAVPTAPFMATGEVGPAQRERLARVLNEAGAAGLFRVVLLHHSPLADGHVWRKRLRDAGEVTATLRTCGAELVIHGHGHEERIDRLTCAAGAMPVVAVPSASHSGVGRAGWNHYRISGSSGRWRLEIEARRSSADGLVTAAREVFEWGDVVSRADEPTSR
jgi:3',5'-cyclic AMP phosphodiesterase CpdA